MQNVFGISASEIKRKHSDRLTLMVILSVALHLIVVFGLTFKPPHKNDPKFAPTLDVVLVNSKTRAKPLKADVLAQANLDGGGNTDADRRAKNPLPILSDSEINANIEEQRQTEQEQEIKQKKQLVQLHSKHSTNPEEAISEQQTETPTPKPDGMQLLQRSMETARLEAQIARNWDGYQKRPKRRFIGGRAQEYRFARYEEDWRIKVEKVGNLNYPEEAKTQKLYGQLELTVSISSDGSIERTEITRSSGHKVLDDAAIRIVRLAAPYAPFPSDIKKDTDVLAITRTWIFTRDDQLVSQ